MAQRLLRTSVLGMLTVALLLGGGPVRADVVHSDSSASIVDLLESSSSQPSAQHELRPAIAFTSSRAYPPGPPSQLLLTAEIYLKMMLNGDTWDTTTPPLRLTENGSGEAFAAIRPDGKTMVFDSNRDRDAPGHRLNLFISDLYLMNLEDSDDLQRSVPDAKQVHLTRGSSATWSPDGKKIAFQASRSGMGPPVRGDAGAPTEDSDIWVMNVDDCLNNLVDCRAKEKAGQPGVLPDFLKNLTRGTSPTIIDEDPDWSPDGQKIVFTSHDGEQPTNPHTEIYVMNADGTGTPQGLTVNTEEERGPAWSPDGTKIVYMCRRGDFEICVMNADGTNKAQLTVNDVFDATPSWSPDGKYLVFHGVTRPGSPVCGPGLRQLFVMKADGTGEKQLTSAPEDPCGNSFASWDLVRVRVPKAR
jgi:TolB protein